MGRRHSLNVTPSSFIDKPRSRDYREWWWMLEHSWLFKSMDMLDLESPPTLKNICTISSRLASHTSAESCTIILTITRASLRMIGVDGIMIMDLWLPSLLLFTPTPMEKKLSSHWKLEDYLPKTDLPTRQRSLSLRICLLSNWEKAPRSLVEAISKLHLTV